MDLGAISSNLGGPANHTPTCFASNSSTGTRNDYMFLSTELLAYVHKFNVIHDDLIPVHSVLQLDLRMPP